MPSTMSTRAPASSRTVKLSRTTFVVSPGRARCSRASSTSRRSGGTLWKTMAPNGYRNISPPSLGTTSSRTPRRAPGNAGASSRSVRFSSKAMAANSWVVPAIRSPGAALETARCRRTGNVSGTDLEAHSAGSREQGERDWQAHGSALLDQSGRRIGEPLHYPERIHGDLVQVLDSRGGGDVDVGDLTLPVERELDHRPAILVGVELPGGIALAAGVDHLLGPDAADRLLHTVEEAGELEAARVQERSLAFLDAAEVVGHRAARQWTRKADGLIERQLQRALLPPRPARRWSSCPRFPGRRSPPSCRSPGTRRSPPGSAGSRRAPRACAADRAGPCWAAPLPASDASGPGRRHSCRCRQGARSWPAPPARPCRCGPPSGSWTRRS